MVWSAFGASKLHMRTAGKYLTEKGTQVKYLTNGRRHVGLYYDQEMGQICFNTLPQINCREYC